MARITCPNCGEVIEVDPSQVEDLTRQLRDELFAHDLEVRLAEANKMHEAQEQAVRTEERREADRRVAEIQAQLADLQVSLKASAHQGELAVEKERAAAGEELARLQAKLDGAAREQELALERERATAADKLARLQARLDAAEREQELAVQQAQAKAADERAQLQARLDAVTHEGELALQQAQTLAEQEKAALQHQLDEQRMAAKTQEQESRERAREREGALADEVTRLKAELSAQELALKAQAEAEVLKATASLEHSRSELEAQLKVEQANSERAQASLREELVRREGELAKRSEEQLEAKEVQIQQYKEEVERLRDYRVRLSTKLIGESLERHCESEFNRIRMQAYPRATFEKDNEPIEGTKGDFIFRDYDEDGNELLSIMFEMKNEEEQSANASRKRNEEHFKKLDIDRNKKNCEYAVLVSTLEPDNDFYNAGIADVSWRYPKMFVVRPQCFTTIIGLLKAAALAAHPYRMQLERVRQEEIDVTKFENKVTDIVSGIANDYALASKNYEQAEKDIDAIIAKLEHLKGQLGTAAKHFGTASKRGEKLSIKRLTWGNQTMKAAFAEAKAHEEEDEPIDPDEME